MPSVKPFASYVVNSLYDNNFFTDDLPLLLTQAGSAQERAKWFRIVKRIFADNPPRKLNESQLEAGVIKPMLGILGWFVLPQDIKVIQGKNIRCAAGRCSCRQGRAGGGCNHPDTNGVDWSELH